VIYKFVKKQVAEATKGVRMTAIAVSETKPKPEDLRKLLQTASIKTIQNLYPMLTKEDFMSAENLSEEMDGVSFLDRAKRQLELGAKIIPLMERDKIPLKNQNGVNIGASQATNDLTKIKEWGDLYPSANSGMVSTGEIGGLCFLDLDDEEEVVKEIKRDTGYDPSELFFRVRTSIKSSHCYLRHTAASVAIGNLSQDIVDKEGKKSERWSFRGKNQYVCGIGSVHPSGPVYARVENGRSICDVTPWLISWMLEHATDGVKKSKPTSRIGTGITRSETGSLIIDKAAPDPGFKKLVDLVGYSPLTRRIEALSNPRLSSRLEPGSVVPCPMPSHKHKDYSLCFGPLADNPLMIHCLGNCKFSGDIVKAVYEFDGGSEKYGTMYDAARVICTEEGLNFNDIFRVETVATSATATPTITSDLDIIEMENVEAGRQLWFWENRMPLNALTNFVGDPDKGKSLVVLDVVSRVSQGLPMPDGSPNPFGGPKKVLILCAEDSLITTIKPRLIVMDADMTRIRCLKSVVVKNEKSAVKRQLYLEQDLERLRELLSSDREYRLVVFDPITNFMDERRDMNKSQDVRKVLTPVRDMAEELGVTVVSILHFNKNTQATAMARTGGAAAWTEVPRAVWCFSANPDDPENYLMTKIKCNNGKRIGGMSYSIEETFIVLAGERCSEPKLTWGKEPVEKTAQDILSQQMDPDQSGIAKARAWLQTVFPDDLARSSAAVYKAAEEAGFGVDAIKRARLRAGYKTKKIGQHWYTRGSIKEHGRTWKILINPFPKEGTRSFVIDENSPFLVSAQTGFYAPPDEKPANPREITDADFDELERAGK